MYLYFAKGGKNLQCSYITEGNRESQILRWTFTRNWETLQITTNYRVDKSLKCDSEMFFFSITEILSTNYGLTVA